MFEFFDTFKLPKINDPKYQEIAGFEEYEYKNNIAYEFAIRNEQVLQSLQEFEKDFTNYEKKGHKDLGGLVDYIDMQKYRFLQEAGFDLFVMTHWLFRKRASRDDGLAHKKNDELCELCRNTVKYGEKHALYSNLKPLVILFSPAFESGQILEGLSCKYIKLKNQKIHEVRQAKNGRIIYLDEKDPVWNPTGRSNQIHPDDIEDDIVPSIIYSFKRPRMRSRSYHATFNLPINLEMDKDALKEYVMLLKKEYDERANRDTAMRTTLKVQREKYIEKSSCTNKEKKHIAQATVMMYDELRKEKCRARTAHDIFGDTYIHPEKPKFLGSLRPERVIEILYTWDSIVAAAEYNHRLKTQYESYQKNYVGSSAKERKDDQAFYKSTIKTKRMILDEIYKKQEKRAHKSAKHKYVQHEILADKLIRDMQYKFLI